MYYQQQNKWYSYKCLLAHLEATLDFSHSEIYLPIITYDDMLLCASKFGTAKMDCSFEMGN